MEFEEFEKLNRLINTQESLIKELVQAQKENKGFEITWKEYRLPRYYDDSDVRYGHSVEQKITLPVLTDANEGLKRLTKAVESSVESIAEIHHMNAGMFKEEAERLVKEKIYEEAKQAELKKPKRFRFW